MAAAKRRPIGRISGKDEQLLLLARAIARKDGGREALERLGAADEVDVSLAALVLPEGRPLAFFDPARFPDRRAVREFLRGEEFQTYVAIARQALIYDQPGVGESGTIAVGILHEAREALFFVLSDLETLVAIALDEDGGPIALRYESQPDTENRRVPALSAMARLAASLAFEGAPFEDWRLIFDALHEAARPGRGSDAG